MKKLFFILSLIFPLASYAVGLKAGSKTVDQKVEQLLSKMSIEEKVGQMTQISLDVVSKDVETNPIQEFDLKKLEEAIIKHNVGSILNITSDKLPSSRAFAQDHWLQVITTIQKMATEKTRLKIPVIYGIDAIHGAQYTQDSTIFPQAINMAATRNRELGRKMAEITAKEVKASGIPWNFCPLMDVARQPLWSRVFETYGEDPYLVAQMGSEYVRAHEAQGVATSLKHYVGYSFPFTGKDRTPAHLSERYLRDVFLPSFAAGVKAGAKTIMVNSSTIDGLPGHANKKLLVDILRKELGFKGFTISDWRDIEDLYLRHRIARTAREAVKIAVMAGVDMSMVPYSFSFYHHLVSLVKSKEVPISRINEAVRRILKVKFETGLFDQPIPSPLKLKSIEIGSEASRGVNLQAAQESLVLVKNDDNTLPIDKNKKVLVAGPNSNLLSALNGGWTITWLGEYEQHYPKNKLTAVQAIQAKIGKDNVIYKAKYEEALDVAKRGKADVAVLFLGEKTYTEAPGIITDLDLDEEQTEWVQQMEKTNTPVVIVMLEGRTRIIRTIEPAAKAIVIGFLPGMEGGPAIADVLFGDVNTSGKLPVTYPRYANDLTTYDHFPNEDFGLVKFHPQWEFGFGLSYTTFEYSDLKLSSKKITAKQPIKVSVTVKNTGSRAGKEVVQMFVTDTYGTISRPVYQLKGFEKIDLKPGESKTVTMTLTLEDLSFVNGDNKRVTEPGEFVVTIQDQKASFNY